MGPSRIRIKDKDKKAIVDKLIECWSKGCSDREACYIAGITQQALNDWLYDKKNRGLKIDGLVETRDLAKNNPSYMARINVYNSLKKGNMETSKWYLEHKNSDEFSTKVQTESDVSVSNKTIEEKEQEMLNKIDELINK